ncbi:MAG: hypothetical protein ACJA13_000787 [Paraglaciecola sp.]|jgi:hypothetical protein
MLKNIRLHLEKNDEKQAQLDDELAQQIIDTRNNNINAFQRNIPSVVPYLTDSKLLNYTLFNNKYGEVNIVNFSAGRTLYGFHPADEINQQVSQALQNSPWVDITKNAKHREYIEETPISFNFRALKSFKMEQAQPPLPEEVECLVILGCGLGLHIKQLLENRKIKNMIIYEPQVQYFQCSIMATSWQEIFALGKKQGTALFLQLGKDGRDLFGDINELKEHASLSTFHVYKHYNHQIFDSVYRDICERDWQDIGNNGFRITQANDPLEYIPAWTPKVDLARQSPVSTESKVFKKNLQAFKKHLPDIYAQYKNYTPKTWLPINSPRDEINVLKAKGLYTWYGDSPKQDCISNFENFNQQPNKDGLVLGYAGKKLAHYIHYQFVNETQELLKEAKEEVGELPETVASIIMFGLGVGYQLETLLSEHTVDKLFICEPNPDFFYASLFAIDWQAIFEQMEATDANIYVNIGDDGSDLFSGLITQFHVIGSYILNNTYFYQSYYNAPLNTAVAQLREQLQLLLPASENFDSVYYGIRHTKEGFRRNIPLLSKSPSRKLSYDDKEVPVFIVGNGPSLDLSIEAIKEWQQQAIIISCGTALQALHRQGITPDFHAEIEQNRCTYDWAVLIGDLEYLKKITLISCNGIHPDTCGLYKDVLIAFKEGESSTVSALSVLGQQHFEVLQYAFPTVSNFATNLFSVLGFNHIYLMGVDLGFVDVKHHHSKSSGYYQKDGKETYNYTENNNTSLVVPGNFRTHVNTKHEFKICRQIIEQVIHNKPKEQTFYNCSDGAKISGTNPLHIDDLLIVSSPSQKKHVIEHLKSAIFSTQFSSNFIERYETKFSHSLLMNELCDFARLLEQEITTIEQANQIVDKQKKILFTSYQNGKSLLFYYLYGTMNYANAVLTKLISINPEDTSLSACLSQAIDKWRETVKKINLELVNTDNSFFDISSYNINVRELECLKLNYRNGKLIIITDSYEFEKFALYFLQLDFPWLKVSALTLAESQNLQYSPDYCLYFLNSEIELITTKGRLSTVVVNDSFEHVNTLQNLGMTSLVFPHVNEKYAVRSLIWIVRQSIKVCLNAHKSSVILPKYWSSIAEPFNNEKLCLPKDKYLALDYNSYICLYNQTSETSNVSQNGTAGKPIHKKLLIKDILMPFISKENLENIKNRHLDIEKKVLKS